MKPSTRTRIEMLVAVLISALLGVVFAAGLIYVGYLLAVCATSL